jgi:hypothetical protein
MSNFATFHSGSQRMTGDFDKPGSIWSDRLMKIFHFQPLSNARLVFKPEGVLGTSNIILFIQCVSVYVRDGGYFICFAADLQFIVGGHSIYSFELRFCPHSHLEWINQKQPTKVQDLW